jgi:hypothetical protein
VRSPLTVLVIAAVLGVGIAAAVDALPRRGGEDTRTVQPPLGTEEATAALRAAGVRGVITYSDQGCRLHSVRLPDLTPASAPTIRSCEPHVPSEGIGAWRGDVVWSGFGFGTIQVVLPRERIDRSVRRWIDADELGVRAVQAVSLQDQRYALLLEDEARRTYMAFFDANRLLALYPLVEADHTLRPSPGAHYVALLTRGSTLQVFTRAGQPQRLPPVANPHAIAWSPDDAWTALATSRSVYVFRSGEDDNTLPRIPLVVRDLNWDAAA